MLFPIILAIMPAFGSFLHEFYHSWRFLFWLMFIYSSFITFLNFIFCPQVEINKEKIELGSLFSGMKRVLKNKSYIHNIIIFSLMMFIFVSYVTLAAPLMIKTWGVSSSNFGKIQILLGSVWILGSSLNLYLSKKLSTYKLLQWGLILLFISFLSMLILYYVFPNKVWAFVLPVAFIYFTITIIFSNSFLNCILPFKKDVGSASALARFLQYISATLASSYVAYLPDNSQFYFACSGLILSLYMLKLAFKADISNEIK